MQAPAAMKKMPPAKLIIDTRERLVTRHQKELAEINHEIIQITTADYVITRGDKIIVAIERKTLEDFAASLKDGRSDNKNKLFKLRDDTNCRIVYIVEGPAFPSPSETFGRIPYFAIESSIFHLMLRDGVTVLRTRDTLGTIQTLGRMIKSINNLQAPIDLTVGGVEPQKPVADIKKTLTQTISKTDHEICREMWSSFGGISIESADDYNSTWTIAQIVRGEVPRSQIIDFKLRTGRKISKKVVQSLTGVNTTMEARLLSKIPGISKATATELVSERTLSQLLSYGEEAMSMCKTGKTRLGKEKAKKIIRLFNYKYVAKTATGTANNNNA